MILLNVTGDGTFSPAGNFGTGIDPVSVFAADFDNDSDLDLAVANYHSNDVSILMNQTGPYAICGDIDGSGSINILDVTYLVNYLYKDGPEPICD